MTQPSSSSGHVEVVVEVDAVTSRLDVDIEAGLGTASQQEDRATLAFKVGIELWWTEQSW
jgi:hypothetical protein